MIGGKQITRPAFAAERPEGVFVECLDERRCYCFVLFSEGSKVEDRNKSQSEEQQILWSGRKRDGEGHSFLFVFLRTLAVRFTYSREGDETKSNFD